MIINIIDTLHTHIHMQIKKNIIYETVTLMIVVVEICNRIGKKKKKNYHYNNQIFDKKKNEGKNTLDNDSEIVFRRKNKGNFRLEIINQVHAYQKEK